MPAVSKAQQRFMGMVYAVKKGEMSAPSAEVATAAASMKKKDAKDFASTKHKGLPDKKEVKEIYSGSNQANAERIKRNDADKKRFAKADARMKFGKFYDKAKQARDSLRPGEVKKWDPEKKRYVSNKE